MKTTLSIISLCCLFISLSSCRSLLTGTHALQKMDEKDILDCARKYKVPPEDCYTMDSSYILFFLSLQQNAPERTVKHYWQPLHLRYYDSDGYLQSLHINCYAGNGLNLNWNQDGIMNSFPPLQQAPLDSALLLDHQIRLLNPLSTTRPFSMQDYDYVVVVYWNRFMGRHSKKMIRAVKRNVSLATGQKVKVIYAHNDNVKSRMSDFRFTAEDMERSNIKLQYPVRMGN